jgi:hypothetical protein
MKIKNPVLLVQSVAGGLQLLNAGVLGTTDIGRKWIGGVIAVVAAIQYGIAMYSHGQKNFAVAQTTTLETDGSAGSSQSVLGGS